MLKDILIKSVKGMTGPEVLVSSTIVFVLGGIVLPHPDAYDSSTWYTFREYAGVALVATGALGTLVSGTILGVYGLYKTGRYVKDKVEEYSAAIPGFVGLEMIAVATILGGTTLGLSHCSGHEQKTAIQSSLSLEQKIEDTH